MRAWERRGNGGSGAPGSNVANRLVCCRSAENSGAGAPSWQTLVAHATASVNGCSLHLPCSAGGVPYESGPEEAPHEHHAA